MPKALAENYEYNLPEGYSFDPILRQKLDGLVDKAQMTEVLAQRFVDLHVELMEDYAARLEQATSAGMAEYAPEDKTT